MSCTSSNREFARAEPERNALVSHGTWLIFAERYSQFSLTTEHNIFGTGIYDSKALSAACKFSHFFYRLFFDFGKLKTPNKINQIDLRHFAVSVVVKTNSFFIPPLPSCNFVLES
jgi:hypothetical protein